MKEELLERPFGFLMRLVHLVVDEEDPFDEIGACVKEGRDRRFGQMGAIVFSADGTGEEMGKGFVEFFGSAFVGVGRFFGVSDGYDVKGVPEKRPPDFRRQTHPLLCRVI